MKTDNYTNLCLEQAASSPLHFRHGCIIVRGGKVLGRGYNDYRPGFNSGVLKSGRTGTTTIPPSASASKSKTKHKSKPKHLASTSTVSTPLSMHAEMAAIHAALASCTAGAGRARCHLKPRFKLPGGSKRAAARAAALQAFKSCALKGSHVGQSAVNNKGKDRALLKKKNGGVKEKKIEEGKPSPSRARIVTNEKNKNGMGLQQRMKYPRLHGADLYVARLSNRPESPYCAHEVVSPSISPVAPPRSSSPSSLHDELTNPCHPSEDLSDSPPVPMSTPRSTCSRPCYRCITYMHSVGIKRVFWTTLSGTWAGSKVRDLVDSLDACNLDETGIEDDAAFGNTGMFVTKHEVLRMRLAMRGSTGGEL